MKFRSKIEKFRKIEIMRSFNYRRYVEIDVGERISLRSLWSFKRGGWKGNERAFLIFRNTYIIIA